MRVYILKAPGKKPVFSTLTTSEEDIKKSANLAKSARRGEALHEAVAHVAVLTLGNSSIPKRHDHDFSGWVMKGGERGSKIIPASFRENAQETRLAAGEGRVYKAMLIVCDLPQQ